MLTLSVVLSGCPAVDRPAIIRVPEIVGEIVSRELLEGTEVAYTLATGDEIRFDQAAIRPIMDEVHAPHVGDLLLWGDEPDGPWYWAHLLRDDPSSGHQCARHYGPALGEGDFIVFESSGLQLPKAKRRVRGRNRAERTSNSDRRDEVALVRLDLRDEQPEVGAIGRSPGGDRR